MTFQETPIDIKIAYIGGGSRYWAKMVTTDLALCPHLKGEVARMESIGGYDDTA